MTGSLIFFALGITLIVVTYKMPPDDPRPQSVQLRSLAGGTAFLCLLAGIGTCSHERRISSEQIAAQHVGHEAMHAQIEKDLKAAEPGDILERPGERRMFITRHRTPSGIDTHSIYNNNDRWEFYISDLVLAHAKIIKLGTPEHAAALEAEAAITFSYYRRKPR